jgi:hypothetical protein
LQLNLSVTLSGNRVVQLQTLFTSIFERADMSSKVFKYEFSPGVPMEEVESSLLLSILGCESLHGETEVHLNATHKLEPQLRTCVIDVGTDVGKDLNRLFAGFLRREFGRSQFNVKRVDELPKDLIQRKN